MGNGDFGYILAPARRRSEPGTPSIQIYLEAIPTREHFDPKTVLISTFNDRGGISHLAIEHPWSGEMDIQVCAGPFDLIDRTDKHVDGFTYGGSLHINVSEGVTALTLESSAPILVQTHHAMANLLAEESEILLAQRRAKVADEEALDQHLIEAEPLKLYRACLEALQERLSHLPYSDDPLMLKFKHMVREERQAVEDQLPGIYDADLDELI